MNASLRHHSIPLIVLFRAFDGTCGYAGVFVGDEGWAKPHDKRPAGACSWGATVCEAGTSETFHSGSRGETSSMYFHGMTTLTPRTLRLSWGFAYRPSPMVCAADSPNGFIDSGRMHYYIKDYQGNVRQVTDADGTVEQDNHYYPIKYIIHYE